MSDTVQIQPASSTQSASLPLLPLTPKDRAILTWVSNRARAWLTGLKRRRKYLPRGEPYSPEEMAAIQALAELESAVGVLLKGPANL